MGILLNMAKQRLAYIDFMKGLCIMLIVMHHTEVKFFDAIAPNLDNALQSFRVPMYYFLSGLFFKTYSGFSGFLRRKVNNLIIPLIFFHVTGYLIAAASYPFLHPGGEFNWSGLWHIVIHRTWPYTMPLWFLASLFEVNVIYYLIKRYNHKYVCVAIIIALSVAPLILASKNTTLPLLLDTAFVGLPFFAVGTLVKSFGLQMPHRFDKWGLLVFPIVAVAVYCLAGHIDIVEQQFPNYFQLYVLPMAAILALMWLCKNLRWWKSDENGVSKTSLYTRIPLIGYWGQFSLIVLGTHDWILTPLDTIFASTLLSLVATALLKFAITMTAMLIIIPLLVRFFPKFTAQKPLLSIQ